MDVQMDKLVGFRNHPFQIKDDESLNALCESIRDYGVLSPLLARPTADGNYEIVSGHRRKAAAIKLGLEKLPVLVREMTDDEAVILMVDSNIQRENLLPSEKAYAYKMKLEAMKRQGSRNDLTCGQVGHKSRDSISDLESGRTIQRYIRLTYLPKPILDLVDEGRIAFSPAVELSYLTKLEQAELWDIMQSEDCTPSLSQAVRMKKLWSDFYGLIRMDEESEKMASALENQLDKKTRWELIQLIDQMNLECERVSLESFISGFRVAMGITREVSYEAKFLAKD